MVYWQIAFGTGYMSIIAGASMLLRSMLVNSTKGGQSQMGSSSVLVNVPDKDGKAEPEGGTFSQDEDKPRARAYYRQIFGHMGLLALVPLALGIVSGSLYSKAETDGKVASIVQSLR